MNETNFSPRTVEAIERWSDTFKNQRKNIRALKEKQ